MNADLIVFAPLALLTAASPGPGVLMTLENTSRMGLRRATWGIAGLALGAVLTSTLAWLGLGMALRAWPSALEGMRWAAAAYLMWLARRAWRAPPAVPEGMPGRAAVSGSALLTQAVVLQLGNPKSLMFFLAVLPRFQGRPGPTAAAIATYACAVVLAHACYGAAAAGAGRWLRRPAALQWMTRLAALAFLIFAAALVASPLAAAANVVSLTRLGMRSFTP
jgi:threonine/homoserine/homoserine lactone efflux protein